MEMTIVTSALKAFKPALGRRLVFAGKVYIWATYTTHTDTSSVGGKLNVRKYRYLYLEVSHITRCATDYPHIIMIINNNHVTRI